LILPGLRVIYDIIAENFKPRRTVVVASGLAFGREKSIAALQGIWVASLRSWRMIIAFSGCNRSLEVNIVWSR
jgi:hypothetical protein